MPLPVIKYTKQHNWIKIEGNNGTVGITDYAQKQLTDIVFIELPQKGKEVIKDKSVATVESIKSVSDIFTPVTGTIIETNKELEHNPHLVNKDPSGKGWIFKIKLKDSKEINSLLDKDKYEKIISK